MLIQSSKVLALKKEKVIKKKAKALVQNGAFNINVISYYWSG